MGQSHMSSLQTYWWTGTDIDLNFLGDENRTQLATLAPTPHAFYKKYVQTNNSDLLKNDVLKALNTTEDYSRDFATRVIDYFAKIWIVQHPLPPEPIPPTLATVPQLPLPPPSASRPLPQPPSYLSTSPPITPFVQHPTAAPNPDTLTRQEADEIVEATRDEFNKVYSLYSFFNHHHSLESGKSFL